MSNRLEKEHKTLDWWDWCDEAFKKAKDENKAIFISIGYPSCHWCHEMQRDVFENQECTDILNENFVCIKVDKEDRPDIDKHYQNVHQLLNNRAGGWPLSIFSTPQNKPVFGGTYIAPESEEGSIEGMGFKEISKLIALKVKENDEELFKNADEIDSFLNNYEHPKEATVLKEDFYKNFLHQVKNNYDTKYGGFSKAPKFPQANTLNTLMSIDRIYDDKSARSMVQNTLQNMVEGGFYDLKNGGFCRYAMDDEWKEANNEKTLYDNALLCEVFIKAYLTYKDEFYLNIAKKTADYCIDKIDEKIQTSSSSMMINSLFALGAIDSKYNEIAIKNITKLLGTMHIDEELYHTTRINEKPKVKAFLEDYAFLSQALVTAFKHTGKEIYLVMAQRFINTALERFYKLGKWNFSDGEFEILADISDNTYTSSVAVMVEVMLSLGLILDDEKYSHFAFKTLEYNSYEIGRRSVLYPKMIEQVIRYTKGDRIIKTTQDKLNSNIYKLSTLNYPFVLLKSNSDKDFMLYSDNSCFANTNNVDEIDKLIVNSF